MNNRCSKCLVGFCRCKSPKYIRLEKILGKFEERMRSFTYPTSIAEKHAEKHPGKTLVTVPALTSSSSTSSSKTGNDYRQDKHITPASNGSNIHYLNGPTKTETKKDEVKIDSDGIIRTAAKKSREALGMRKPRAVSFISCSSHSGLFVEHSITLWMDSSDYSKTEYNKNTDRYRFAIQTIYDVEEDLYMLSGKLIKRSTYSVKDEDADPPSVVQPILCTQKELKREIKRMLIWASINPVSTYRLFRKKTLTQNLNVTHSQHGFITASNEDHEKLTASLDKTSYTTHANGGWPHGGSTFHDHGNVHSRHGMSQSRQRVEVGI